MTRPETAREIDDAAALWAVRAGDGELSPALEAELEAWLADDPRRIGSYARACAVAVSLDKAKALHGISVLAPRPVMTRRTAVAALSGMAASVAAGLLIWPGLGSARTLETRLGEVRVHSMDDGSIVTLNTASQVVVDYGKDVRDVRLVAGEAIFDVAHDAARPFTVRAGDVRVRAIGTSFLVRALEGQPPEVVVREGAVDVSWRGAENQPLRLVGRQRVVGGPGAKVEALAEDRLARELAWLDGRLAFEGDTLAQAAAAFARYSEIRLVFEDPGIAEERVTGLFVSTDPVGFAQAVASAFDLEAKTYGGEVRLHRRR